MSTKKTINESFAIRVGFVDDTYWDDGNRSTSCKLTFTKKRERDSQFREFQKTGIINAQGQEARKDFHINWMQKVDTVEVVRDYEMR